MNSQISISAPASTRMENADISVVLGTYNRLVQLKRCIESILRETRSPCKVYVTDAGSTDGTVEYLREVTSEQVIPIFAGKKLGQAKAYNDVFSIINTPHTCWLSDDNVVVDHGLDRALDILKSDSRIGMVALKTKDMQGPFVYAPYIGGISEIGILNVNQGALPTGLLRQIGGFSEKFRDYGIDPALTADVLFAGYKVVYTKQVALHHYRNWSEDSTSDDYKWLQARHAAARKLYSETYGEHNVTRDLKYRLKSQVGRELKRIVSHSSLAATLRQSALVRDMFNVLSAKYINILDPFLSVGKDYHLVQQVKGGASSQIR